MERTILRGGGIRWGMFSELFAGGVYFVGIGGVSMSALARLLNARGVRVRGSDAAEGPFFPMLRKAGIPVSLGCEETISEDNVVFTGAVDGNHPQLAAARRAGKRLLPRAELLGMIAERFKRTVSFAGCHGKTTATAMLSHILLGRRPFTCHIGGEDLTLSNYHAEGEDVFVTEACEFQRSFFSLKSSIAVVLNIELDHTDCYHSEEELFAAFREFAGRAERVIVNADDIRARSLPHALSFGLFSGEIRASALKNSGERYSFTVTEKGVPLVRVQLAVAGKVHIYNALAAFAAARLLGLAPQEIADGLSSFRGVKRRFERIGFFHGVPVVSDYAHHPREIAATIQTAQAVAWWDSRTVRPPPRPTAKLAASRIPKRQSMAFGDRGAALFSSCMRSAPHYSQNSFAQKFLSSTTPANFPFSSVITSCRTLWTRKSLAT